VTTPRQTIYLDHNASAPLLPEARAAHVAALDLIGNPSSVHANGRALRGIIDKARADVAKLAGGHVLRVMEQAEKVAASMKSELPATATEPSLDAGK